MAGLGDTSGGSGAVRAGRAFVELFADDNAVYRALERLKARFQSFSGFAIKAGSALGAAGVAGAAAFKPALDALSEQAKIADAADAFGISAEKASRLFGIMAAGGSDLRDATEGIVTFNDRISDALTGSGEEAKKFFRDLGKGPGAFQPLDSADRFFALIDALRQVPDPAKRVQLLMKAVGEDTGKNLIPVLSMSADQIRNLGDAMQSSAADLQSAREASRAQTMAVAQLGRIWREVAAAVAPDVKRMADAISRNVGPVVEWVRANRQVIATAFAVAGGLVAAGAAFVGLGLAAGGVAAAISGFLALAGTVGAVASAAFGAAEYAVGLLLSPVGLVAAAVAALGYLFVTQTETGRDAFASLKGSARDFAGAVRDGFLGAFAVAQESWGGIVAAVQKGDLSLAGQIAVTTLELAWAGVVAKMTAATDSFVAAVVGAWHQIEDGWHEATDGIGALLVALWEVAQEKFTGIWQSFKAQLAFVGAVAKEVVNEVVAAFDGIKEKAAGLLGGLAVAFAPVVGLFEALGKIGGEVAALLRDAWDGTSTNIMESLNNLASWTEKVFVAMGANIGNMFRAVARTALDAALSIAKGLNDLPGINLTTEIGTLERLRADVAKDVDVTAEIDRIERARKTLEDQLRKDRAEAKAIREAGRIEDTKVADDRVAELEKKLAELNAKAREAVAPRAPKIPDLAPALAMAGTVSGSRGSFTAAAAAGRFGADRFSQKQLKAAEDTARNTEATVGAVAALARGLRFK